MLGFGTFAELLQEKAAIIYLAIRGEQIPADSGFELVETGVYRKAIRADDDAAANLTHLVQAGARIFEAQQQRMSLEDLYFAYQHDAMSTMNG